jgi:hypothetical protein
MPVTPVAVDTAGDIELRATRSPGAMARQTPLLPMPSVVKLNRLAAELDARDAQDTILPGAVCASSVPI